MTSIVSSYFPPSTTVELDRGDAEAPAAGYERECLLKLKEAYQGIRVTIQEAIGRLDEWAPEWNSRYDKLDGTFSDEETMLIHMRIDLLQEEFKFSEAKQQREFWRAYIPPVESEVDGRRSVGYRMQRLSRAQEAETNHSFRIETLKVEIVAQEKRVDDLRKDVIPSRSVINYAKKSYDLLSSVERMLSQEYLGILARIPQPIDKVPDDIWSNIFLQAVESQEWDNNAVISKGCSLECVRSPRQLALSIAGVCRRWRDIALAPNADNELVLWRSILVEATNLSNTEVPSSLIPEDAGRRQRQINATVITQIADNFGYLIPPLIHWLRRFNIAHLGFIYQDASATRIAEVLGAAADNGFLRSVMIMSRDEENVERIVLEPNMLSSLRSLELVDLDIDSSTLNARMEELKSLRIRYTRPVPIHKRMAALSLYHILSYCPWLVELEVDLGFEDTPEFIKTKFPRPLSGLKFLRTLQTRFSYFQNRLLLLRGLPLCSLESIIFTNVPSCTSQRAWDFLKELLESNGLGQRITHVEVLNILPQPRGLVDAGFITSKLPNLHTLSLHHLAVEHFIRYLLQTLRDREFPLLRIQHISLWDAPITDETLAEFVRTYCDTMPSVSAGPIRSGNMPGRIRDAQLRSIELYRCNGVSTNTLHEIAYMLRGFGRSWHVEDQSVVD